MQRDSSPQFSHFCACRQHRTLLYLSSHIPESVQRLMTATSLSTFFGESHRLHWFTHRFLQLFARKPLTFASKCLYICNKKQLKRSIAACLCRFFNKSPDYLNLTYWRRLDRPLCGVGGTGVSFFDRVGNFFRENFFLQTSPCYVSSYPVSKNQRQALHHLSIFTHAQRRSPYLHLSG